jgi:anti-anti-sigma factor
MVEQSWEITYVKFERALDLDSLAEGRERFSGVLAREGHVVLDLRGSVLDSSGLSAILSLQRKLELKDRVLLVVSADPGFHRLLEVTGVASALRVVADAEEAVRQARSFRALVTA